jgi:hypothetical protein
MAAFPLLLWGNDCSFAAIGQAKHSGTSHRSDRVAILLLNTKDNYSANSEWVKKVHAPDLLKALFEEKSDAKHQYLKTVHSVALTDWILENDIGHLSELITFLKEALATPRL